MEAPVVTYIGMSIEELSPYLDRLQAGIAYDTGDFCCRLSAGCYLPL